MTALDVAGLRYSRHASERMRQFGITVLDTWDAVVNADQSWTDPQGRTTYQAGPIGVVVADDRTVVTVLLKNQSQWSHDHDSLDRTGGGAP